MDLLVHYLSLATKSIFVENILLAFFLGMCSFLAVSKNVEASKGIGKAVIFVNGLTVPINWIIKTYLLAPGALYKWIPIESLKDVNLSFLSLITVPFNIFLVILRLSDDITPFLTRDLDFKYEISDIDLFCGAINIILFNS